MVPMPMKAIFILLYPPFRISRFTCGKFDTILTLKRRADQGKRSSVAAATKAWFLVLPQMNGFNVSRTPAQPGACHRYEIREPVFSAPGFHL
jgi:hypothetical protein